DRYAERGSAAPTAADPWSRLLRRGYRTGAVRILGEDVGHRAVDARVALGGVLFARDAADRDALPHQAVARGVDQVDVERALGVAIDVGAVAPVRHHVVATRAVAVVVRVIDRRHRADIGAPLGIGVDVEPQVGLLRGEHVAARFHLRARRRLHPFAGCRAVTFLLDRQRRIGADGAAAPDVRLTVRHGGDERD